MNLEQQIRECASRGYSRDMTRDVLGLGRVHFRQLTARLADVQWPPRGQSLGEREGRACANWWSEARMEVLRRASQARRETFAVVEFCGRRDSYAGHYATWRDLAEVSYAQFRRRMRNGDNLIDALFTPPKQR